MAVLVLTVLLAAANGANDVAKGVATLAGAGVTRYRTAIMWGAATTLLGGVLAVWLGAAMQSLFASGIVDTEPTARFALAVLTGTAGWVTVATLARLPVSTTHALVGSLVGVGLMTAPGNVQWSSLLAKVAVPLLAGAVLAYLVTALLTHVRREQPIGTSVAVDRPRAGQPAVASPVTRRLHWLSSGAVGAARGLNDTPKLAAVGGFVLVPAGFAESEVVMLIAVAMAVGALVAGTRVARRLGDDVVPLTEEAGLRANITTALFVGAGAGYGLPLSTTHVSTGAIAGVAGTRTSQLNLPTLRDFALAWTMTPLTAGLLAGLTYTLSATNASVGGS
ncbi:MAG: inorganic phosphate transporter [Thermocrispum sp.]